MEEIDYMDEEMDEMDMKMLSCPMMGCPLLQWALSNCPAMQMMPMQDMQMVPMMPMMPMQDMPDKGFPMMPPTPIQGIPMKPMGPGSMQEELPKCTFPLKDKMTTGTLPKEENQPSKNIPIECMPQINCGQNMQKKCCEWDVKDWYEKDERLFGAGE